MSESPCPAKLPVALSHVRKQPVLTACLLLSTAPGLPNGSQAVLGSQEAVFGDVFLDFIKRVSALQASLDY